jgi:5-methylcytosine-specific restriction endonuclease McrA
MSCGTNYGYMKHLKLKNIPCDFCKTAHTEYAFNYKQSNYNKVVSQNNQSSKKYYYKNNDKAKEIRKKWKKNNADKVRSNWRKRHSIQMGANHEPYTEKEVLDTYGIICHICLEKIDLSLSRREPMGFQFDHVIPLSKGGDDNINNVKPSHAVCNQRKNDKLIMTLKP